jgi:hypothetical protein
MYSACCSARRITSFGFRSSRLAFFFDDDDDDGDDALVLPSSSSFS